MASIAPLSGISGSPVQAKTIADLQLNENDLSKLHKTAIQMEAQFDGYMLNEVTKGLPGTSNGQTDEFSGEVFGGIFKQAVSMKMAESNGVNGIAHQFYQENARHYASIEARKQGIALPPGYQVALPAVVSKVEHSHAATPDV